MWMICFLYFVFKGFWNHYTESSSLCQCPVYVRLCVRKYNLILIIISLICQESIQNGSDVFCKFLKIVWLFPGAKFIDLSL
jgi:hypothetical protein